MKSWQVKMPSNIALIKYMGKKDYEKNLPANSSLSWTLDHLCTEVKLELSENSEDSWQSLGSQFPFELSSQGREKFLNHAQRVKAALGLTENFIVSSANSFPADCGIASSASSFAALTEAIYQVAHTTKSLDMPWSERGLLSAQGSGSSCRSFQSGFVQWDENSLSSFSSPYSELHHWVVLVGMGKKEVSSSLAHRRVSTSFLYEGRLERAEKRLEQLKKALQNENWKEAYQISWAEFWDMHSLFETSQPHFGYFVPDSFKVLEDVRRHWELNQDGPIVTMDAGPNVHFLWRADQQQQAINYYNQNLRGHWPCLGSAMGVEFV